MNEQLAYLIYAIETDADSEYSHEVWAVADSYEVAEQIAQSDTDDEQIRPNWFIQKFKLNTKSDIHD